MRNGSKPVMDQKSKARVQRLLTGAFRQDDLMGLFLYARDRCDGRESVAEIGHFVAHHNERDKGIITRATREWFAAARFHGSRFEAGIDEPLDGKRLPAATRDYLKIATSYVSPKDIRKETGLNQSSAKKIANDLADSLIENPDGTLALTAFCTNKEIELFKCLISRIVVRPAFESNRLVDDFIATLKSNSLITKEELRSSRSQISDIVQLYAVSCMHNCVIAVDKNTKCTLKASPSADGIHVTAAVPVFNQNKAPISFAISIFTADLDAEKHCHRDLMTEPNWNFEIEVTPERLLAPLR